MKNSNTGVFCSKWDELIRERNCNRKWLEDNICDLEFGGLYLGDEMNTFHFDWDNAVREGKTDDTWRVILVNMMATQHTLAAPAIMLFYEQLHEYYPDWIIERTMCPPSKFNMDLMKKDGIRPFALESKMPVEAFDVLCMSIDLSGSAVAVPWMIMESGIPLYYADRSDQDTFVILGGSALVNPAPYAPFCDILFMGEGEEILPQLLSMIKDGRRQGLSREEILLGAAQSWGCLYVPRFYEERYRADGRLEGTYPVRNDVPEHIYFNRVKDLDKVFISTRPFVNFSTYAADNSNFEISRGCEGKCSFCLGGFTSLPLRTRSAALIKETSEKTIYETGNTSVTPVSFNSVSHPEINRIIKNLNNTVGDKIRLISMRIDGFRNNPELCCFISMQKRGRIAFGVEGASQRLRDLVSKNLSEEQILDTMREVCRRSFAIVKFMMICNLPTETEADLDELYELAVRIREIFMEETPPGARLPRLMISWNSLKVSPHTPLQWARIKCTILQAYTEFRDKIRALGFSTYIPEVTADDNMTHLFLRGDERMSGLLAYLAGEGVLRHNDQYSYEVYEKSVRFLEDNGLPPADEWFREYRWEDAFPWDIVESPASKEYLYRRYLAVDQKKPVSDPICTEGCSGCGACDHDHRKILAAMPQLRESDRRIDLHHPVKAMDFSPEQYVMMEFAYDRMHSVVIPSYWDCEIRRALFHADVLFDPDSIESFGSKAYSAHLAGGTNLTGISLGRRYDTDELRHLINEHAVNFHAVSVTETERPQRVSSVTYRFMLPDGTDEGVLSRSVQRKLSEQNWYYGERTRFTVPPDLRPSIRNLDVRDGHLLITMGPSFSDPRLVFRYIMDIPPGELIYQMPERAGFTLENRGVIDLAMTREMRDARIRGLESSTDISPVNEAEAVYLSGNLCYKDLESIIARNYSIFSEDNNRSVNMGYLLGLIDFTASVSEIPEAEDPAMQDLKRFLSS